MPSMGKIGEILDPRGKTYVEWNIHDYFLLSQKANLYFESPPFHFFNAQWYIRIFPNGCTKYSSVGWIDLYLYVHCPVSSYYVTFKLGIKYLEKEIVSKGPRFRTFDSSKGEHGFTKICKRDDLLLLMEEHSLEGTLVVYCDAITAFSTAVEDAASQTAPDSTAVLCRDFLDLFQSQRKSDITIEVCGRIFKAHKLILEARSPVFSAMFDHNMKENSESIVEISDCDPDAFHDFLKYVYAGKLEKCSWDNVIHLFAIADKYCMPELKERCAEYMEEEMLIDNACDILVVADRHNAMELKESAETLLIENMTTFKATDKWKSFVVQNPLLAVEILMKFVPDESHSSEEDDLMHVETDFF